MTTEATAKRLTPYKLNTIRNYDERALSWRVILKQKETLFAHIDAIQAELDALQAPGDVDVEELAAQASTVWHEESVWSAMTVGMQASWLRATDYVVSRLSSKYAAALSAKDAAIAERDQQLADLRAKLAPRELTGTEVEKLAQGARVAFCSDSETAWEDLAYESRDRWRHSVRFVASKLQASGSAELAGLRAKCEELDKRREEWRDVTLSLEADRDQWKERAEAANEELAKQNRKVANLRDSLNQIESKAKDREKLGREVLVITGARQPSTPSWDECREELRETCMLIGERIAAIARYELGERFNRLAAELADAKEQLVAKERELHDARTAATEEAAAHDEACQQLAAAQSNEAGKVESSRLEILQSFIDEVLRIERIAYPSSQVEALERLVDRRGDLVKREIERPRIVCLCGSGRFRAAFEDAEFRETAAGKIVLTIGCNTKDIARDVDWAHLKPMLDDLHKRKIDLCDEVLVLDVDGYIGESTRSEIEHAERLGKPIRYLSQEAPESAAEQPAPSAINLDELLETFEPLRVYLSAELSLWGDAIDSGKWLSWRGNAITFGHARRMLAMLERLKADHSVDANKASQPSELFIVEQAGPNWQSRSIPMPWDEAIEHASQLLREGKGSVKTVPAVNSGDANKKVEAPEPTGFRAFATNRARSQAAGYAARAEQPPTLGSEPPAWNIKAILADLAKQPAPSKWKSLAGAVDACDRALPLLQQAVDDFCAASDFDHAAEARDAREKAQHAAKYGARKLVEHFSRDAEANDAPHVSPPLEPAGTQQVRYVDAGELPPRKLEDEAEAPEQFECPACGSKHLPRWVPWTFRDKGGYYKCWDCNKTLGTWADVRAAKAAREAAADALRSVVIECRAAER